MQRATSSILSSISNRASISARSARSCANSSGSPQLSPRLSAGGKRTSPTARPPIAGPHNQNARPRSPAWTYLTQHRQLPFRVLAPASAADVLREGPYGSAWFAHRDDSGNVTHVEIRGPTYKGSLKGGTKTLFRFHGGSSPPARFVLAEAPIDALSLAAIEGLRRDTLYAATGGGMGTPTIEAITHILSQMAAIPGAVFCSAADANAAGDRYAAPSPGTRRRRRSRLHASEAADRERRLE